MQVQPQQHAEILEFLRTRRSVPAKAMEPDGEGPGEAQIVEMITIASRVPDHGKIAPWRFIRYSPQYCERLGSLVAGRALELDPALSPQMQEIERSRFRRAPVVIALVSSPREHPKVPEWEQVLSCGAAGMNLLLAANAFGWDAQWLTEWVAFDEELAPHLGVGPGERLAGFIHIGTRTMPKSERDRPALEDVFRTMDGPTMMDGE